MLGTMGHVCGKNKYRNRTADKAISLLARESRADRTPQETLGKAVGLARNTANMRFRGLSPMTLAECVEHVHTRLTTQVTGKGQAYSLALYGSGGTQPLGRRPKKKDKGRKKRG